MKMQGCVAVVTGGASGIGKAICQTLAANGAQVCLIGTNAAQGKISADELKLLYGAEKNILFVRADVSSQEQLKGAFNTAKTTFGHIDVVVNNAGILDEKNWRSCVDVNLVGVISGTMFALDYMGKKNGGNGGIIINIASDVGLLPGRYHMIPTYIATKAAVIDHTLSWSSNPICKQEGLRFNVICPGIVNTSMRQRVTSEILIDLTEKDMENYKSAEGMEPSRVADVVKELIEDDTKNGAIMYLTIDRAEQVEYPAAF